MAVQKKIILVFVVFAMFNLCLAKPRWVWLGDVQDDGVQDEEKRVWEGNESSEGKETLQDSDDQAEKRKKLFGSATEQKRCNYADKRLCGRSWV